MISLETSQAQQLGFASAHNVHSKDDNDNNNDDDDVLHHTTSDDQKEQNQQQHQDINRVLTPPNSDDAGKREELDEPEDDDIDEIAPAEYWGGGKIPIFKPTMRQFKDFQKFVDRIDKYGMKSGIVKVIPPKEWLDMRPDLSEAVKSIRIKNPIRQEFNGTHGTYTQANIEKQRTYNLPQWKSLCCESNHLPPAPRGERRRVAPAPSKPKKLENPISPAQITRILHDSQSSTLRHSRGRPRRSNLSEVAQPDEEQNKTIEPTPEVKQEEGEEAIEEDVKPSIEAEAPVKRKAGRPPKKPRTSTGTSPVKNSIPRGKREKAQGGADTITSVSMRRMKNKNAQVWEVDEAAFENFDYHHLDVDQFTPVRCRELEENYWKTINYGTPMYGADMPGSLFKDIDMCWNVSKLPNLLDVLGTNILGVNTAYLYLGMWKATFGWHLEDVDLYSINYIHFGAPKQWYSISQEDARRFEAAMKSIWSSDAKRCDQFLRHKTYLISPEKLKTQFNITVNRLVHYEGEFVITYPYGYHSGFNLDYNCAESVNFANEAWLNYGRIAKKCYCEADSVWVDVYEIERKMRGEPTPEYYEYDELDLDDFDGESIPIRVTKKRPGPKKRKRDSSFVVVPEEPAKRSSKRLRIRVRPPTREPCILCPNDPKFALLLPTDNGHMAHQECALFTPETYVGEQNGREMIFNVSAIDKGRWELKCIYCRNKKGAVFQCSSKKCARAYHATCAAPAGVQIDTGMVPTWGEDGTEYYCEGYDFRCRFHRPKRPKIVDSDSLERNKLVMDFGKELKPGNIVQALLLDSEIFAGYVIENRPDESACLIEVLPDGDVVELEWKYLLVLDQDESLRPKPSLEAKLLPQHLLKTEVSVANRKDGVPEVGDPFHDPIAGQKWAEFKAVSSAELCNPDQTKVDMFSTEHTWYYLGKLSTDSRPQYTHDLRISAPNSRSNFLNTVKPPPAPITTRYVPPNFISHQMTNIVATPTNSIHKSERPYVYKPRTYPTSSTPTLLPAAQATPTTRPVHWPVGPTDASNYQNAIAYTQDMLRQSVPFALSAGHQQQQRYDNSPRQPNYYNNIHERYTSHQANELTQRYQAITQATQPSHASLQNSMTAPYPATSKNMPKYPSSNGGSTTPPLPVPTFSYYNPLVSHPSTALTPFHPNNLPHGPDLSRHSPTLNNLPFTPPSQRPEVTSAVMPLNNAIMSGARFQSVVDPNLMMQNNSDIATNNNNHGTASQNPIVNGPRGSTSGRDYQLADTSNGSDVKGIPNRNLSSNMAGLDPYEQLIFQLGQASNDVDRVNATGEEPQTKGKATESTTPPVELRGRPSWSPI